MATYRLCVYAAKRSEERSATAMAAYRACEVVPDKRTGETHDYTRKSGLLYSEIITPENAPDWARDRAELWNRSEAAHKRGDAVICREMQLSLPHELDAVQRREVTTQFAQHMADRYNIAVDMALHAPNKDGDQRNYHAHLMLCTRPFDETKSQGLGNNVRAFDSISHQKAGTDNHVSQWRKTWEGMLNQALERGNVRDADGAQVKVDHRSYKTREMEQEAQLKEGPAATAMRRRGEFSDRAQINEEIKLTNAAKMDAEELRRRQAKLLTARELALMPKPEASEPRQRQAQNITREQVQQELTASNDNAAEQHTPAPKYTRFKGESETQFEARVSRLKARAEREKGKEEELKTELHYRPSGPTFGR